MHEVIGYLELSTLNSEIAESYLKDAETELSIAVEKLEHCLKLMKQLREYEPLFYNRRHLSITGDMLTKENHFELPRKWRFIQSQTIFKLN